MMKRITLPLLPVERGIDNIHERRSGVFAPGQGEGGGFLPPKLVTAATDVDFLEDGRIRCRDGVDATALYSTVAGRRMFVVGGTCYVQDGTTLIQLATPSPVTLISGLPEGKDVLAHEWPAGSGRVYIACGDTHYRIEGGVVKRWGLPVPTVLNQAAMTGSMTAGIYLASIAYRDGAATSATAQESGALLPVAFTISTATGKRLLAPIADTAVTHVAFYLSRPDQAELFRIAVVAVGTLPSTSTRGAYLDIAATPRTLWTSVPLFGLNWQKPLSELSALGSVQAFFLIGKGNAVYRSWAGRPELYKPGDAMQLFPSNVTDIIGLPDGFFVGTAEGIFWTAGDDPTKWTRTGVYAGEVVPKGIVVNAEDIPSLVKQGFVGKVALMCAGRKLVAGAQGRVVELLADQYQLPAFTRFSLWLQEKRLFIAGA